VNGGAKRGSLCTVRGQCHPFGPAFTSTLGANLIPMVELEAGLLQSSKNASSKIFEKNVVAKQLDSLESNELNLGNKFFSVNVFPMKGKSFIPFTNRTVTYMDKVMPGTTDVSA
jgi:hypothetical protein